MKNSIMKIEKTDIDEVEKLHSLYLNYGEGVRPHLEKVISDDNSICLKYVKKNQIIGIIMANKGIYLSGGHFDICKQISDMVKGEITYTGDALLILKEYRGREILKELFSELCVKLKEKSAKYFLSELWRYPDNKVPAYNGLQNFKNSFFIGTYKNFYKGFYKNGYICPLCGKNCICSADIYLSEI